MDTGKLKYLTKWNSIFSVGNVLQLAGFTIVYFAYVILDVPHPFSSYDITSLKSDVNTLDNANSHD